MKKLISYSFQLLLLLSAIPVNAQSKLLSDANWKAAINTNGHLTSLLVKNNTGWDSIPVLADTLPGISWYYVQNKQAIPVTLQENGPFTYSGQTGAIRFKLQYAVENQHFIVKATVSNNGSTSFQPEKLGLQMGISNYMAGYPQWEKVYFPTMLRCEKTHFTGYLTTPTGKILLVASPDAVASWSLSYNFGYGDKAIFFWGHRIYSFNMDLLNTLPLPERHPQELTALKPGETRTWTIYFKSIGQLAAVEKELSLLINAPSFDIPQTTLEEGSAFNFTINGSNLQSLTVKTPSGKQQQLPLHKNNIYLPQEGAGVYIITAINAAGKSTEAMISIHKPWSWYLQQARLAALKYTQKASWNCENWYGFYSAYLAQQYFPDKQLREKTDERFNQVMGLMYSPQWLPTENKSRIQNHSTTIGILVDKYKSSGNIADLEAAATLADWIIQHSQSADGAYRNGHTHYTSVIYVAKSIMELMVEEKKRAAWKERYSRHYASVKRAIDQLMGGMSVIDTEGELTLEDGMISCTALQIGAFALLQDNETEKKRYTAMMLRFLDTHNCLTQLVKPDSRQRGGTLRFWEAQYDVMLANNMFSSPHGWTAWRIYATYYAYLLTGEEKWLVQTMNALGSSAQLIDFKTGDLRWAFVGDPYINTLQSSANFPNTSADKYNNNQFKTEEGTFRPIVIGEQYVPMVADWFHANSSDNDVHEIFKCLEEVALAAAYVLQRKDGSLLTYNCHAQLLQGVLSVTPAEATVKKVNINLNRSCKVTINWNAGKATTLQVTGRRWINQE
ncbi:hypothetical protein CLV51_102176 [Chitinophaga niastensis]|uniref:Alpha-L-rhamnosidase six-hairpin glycosidase domain-containing protein n=1 Tax=Chitinophaga niastensis TaxID=536980 RepID=A0A2P8HM97_CHINA|nr:hypothetical protein [Chitinophaga niastensis]PSL47330.1 hypothetical protein CLV51_102176 [Chitinophaga niastensis]